MKYNKIPELTIAEIEEMCSSSEVEEQILAALSASLFIEDVFFLKELFLSLFKKRNKDIDIALLTALSHSLRLKKLTIYLFIRHTLKMQKSLLTNICKRHIKILLKIMTFFEKRIQEHQDNRSGAFFACVMSGFRLVGSERDA